MVSLRQGTTKYNKLKDEIVSAICNKKRKALCCPKIINPINDSPTYLPVEGECGINPYKSPAKVGRSEAVKIAYLYNGNHSIGPNNICS